MSGKMSEAYHREYRLKHRERINAYMRKRYERAKNDPQIKSRLQAITLKRRMHVQKLLMLLYGGKCARCPVTDGRVLQLDHVKNDGGAERRKYGTKIKAMVVKGQLKQEDYQLLCANCNWIRRLENSVSKGQWSPEMEKMRKGSLQLKVEIIREMEGV